MRWALSALVVLALMPASLAQAQRTAELDQAKQVSLWEAAQKQITADCVSFPMFTRKYAMAKSKKFDQGFEQKSYSFYQVGEKSRIK